MYVDELRVTTLVSKHLTVSFQYTPLWICAFSQESSTWQYMLAEQGCAANCNKQANTRSCKVDSSGGHTRRPIA